MAFSLEIWKEKLALAFKGWKPRLQRTGAISLYASLSAASLWPIVEATRNGEWAALAALGGVLAGVGSNLIANQIQGWKDQADAAQKIEQQASHDPALRAELDAILDMLGTLSLAEKKLTDQDRAWFQETIQKEIRQLGSRVVYRAQINGDGIIVQGNASGSILNTGNRNVF